MRVGINPEKENSTLSIQSYHRVIIPVYIPNLTEDYFKDGLVILKYCLRSLIHTIHSKTRISIINNGCCPEVSDYLHSVYSSTDSVDQLLDSKTNLGKVNAIYSAVKSNLEPLITISDADVMFLPAWQYEVEKILHDLPQAGMVSPVPSSVVYRGSFTKSTLFYGLFMGKIKVKPVKDPDGLEKFQNSIDRHMYDDIHKKKFISVGKNTTYGVMGCGHFVATLKSEVFQSATPEVCAQKIVGGSENKYFDLPNDKGGFLRLATLGNYGYHMGNKEEAWMKDKLEEVLSAQVRGELFDSFPVKPLKKWQYRFGSFLHKILLNKFRKVFLGSLGLPRSY